MSFFQYLKDTRSELNHVAWPTRFQTITYTALVVVLSVFIALYLGFFDYLFTTSLARSLNFIPHTPAITVTQSPATSSAVQGSPITITPSQTSSNNNLINDFSNTLPKSTPAPTPTPKK